MSTGLAGSGPSGRTLAAWWPSLAPLAPRLIAVGSLDILRLDATVRVELTQPLAPIEHLLLTCAAGLPDEPFVRSLCSDLARDGLIESTPLKVTPAGRAALNRGNRARNVNERRSFAFALSPVHPPHLLPPPPTEGVPLQPIPPFELSQLDACIHQPLDWKKQFGFPLDVREILVPQTGNDNWERVPLARAEQHSIVLVLAHVNNVDMLHVFTFRAQSSAPDWDTPWLQFASGWESVFPELHSPIDAEAWRPAWTAWCRERKLPPEAAACRLSVADSRLIVHASGSLLEVLCSPKAGDIARQEAWLMLARVRFQQCVRIELADA